MVQVDKKSFILQSQYIALNQTPKLLFKQCHSLIDVILPKGPYLPCVSMAGRALLAGYPRNLDWYQSVGFCCHHLGHVYNASNPLPPRHGTGTSCAHKPSCIMTTDPSRWVLTHCPWVNVCIDYECVIFTYVIVTTFLSINIAITLRWMVQDPFHNKSTLVQIIAWCHQATSRELSQYWPRSLSLYGITRTQWVNSLNSLPSFGNVCSAPQSQLNDGTVMKFAKLLKLRWCHMVCADIITIDGWKWYFVDVAK